MNLLVLPRAPHRRYLPQGSCRDRGVLRSAHRCVRRRARWRSEGVVVMDTSAASECGYCEGHGYTERDGNLFDCDRCGGTGKVSASAATVRHSMTLVTSNVRNIYGARVRVASCDCADGWQHMTAYRLFRRKRADKYLERRWIDHVFPEGGYA